MTIKWNYRVFLEDNGDYIIREVFYEADGAIADVLKMLWNLGEKAWKN